MTIVRIIYLALLIGSGLFVILYIDSLSMLLFLVVLALPIILFLLLLLARLLTKVTVELDRTIATAGEAVSVRLRLHNRSFVALPGIRVQIAYCNAFVGEEEKTELNFPLHALTKQTAYCDIRSDHIGLVRLQVSDMILHDYFHLFSMKIKIRQEYEISFLPEILPVSVGLRPNTFLNGDSDIFSKTKKGDDPSEVFAIRDYVGGDKLNRIHWKLSSKQDTLMVKDYSLPINNCVLILLELSTPNGDLTAIDAAVQTAISLSHCLCEAEIVHYISWYDPKGARFLKEKIKTGEDLYAVLGMLLASGISHQADSFTFWKKERDVYSHVAYISAVTEEGILQEISEMPYTSFYSVFEICPDGRTAAHTAQTRSMQLYPVPGHGVFDALTGVQL